MQPTNSVSDLQWLLNNLITRVKHLQHAVVLSRDGLLLEKSAGLGKDEADQFSAMASGLLSVARSAGRLFSTGSVRQAVVEMDGGFMAVTAAGPGANLAVLTGADADMGAVTYEMALLVAQVGKSLTAADRGSTDPGAAP